MAHLVSAFVDANRAVFARVATDSKSHEIEAIPRLPALLDLEGATVTVDAIGCQREVVDRGWHYVLAVKASGMGDCPRADNQPTLHARVKALLDEAVLDRFAGMSHGRHTVGR